MHYEINYAELSPAEKQEKAIADIKEYRGAEWFDDMTTKFREYGHMTEDRFAAFCSISGVSGYPIKAWYKHVYGKDTPNEE